MLAMGCAAGPEPPLTTTAPSDEIHLGAFDTGVSVCVCVYECVCVCVFCGVPFSGCLQ